MAQGVAFRFFTHGAWAGTRGNEAVKTVWLDGRRVGSICHTPGRKYRLRIYPGAPGIKVGQGLDITYRQLDTCEEAARQHLSW